MATPRVHLNEGERHLRGLLLDVAEFIDKKQGASEPLVLRWSGGWVRDKLLGIDSHDIDVAINAMTGVTFAEHISEYCDKPHAVEKHALKPSDIGNLHKVARNPEKSKHLETAMVRMFDLDLDFVNLRKETYTQDSRNPQVEFGSAEEDAMRRDATVNALFYNLNTDSVEDFTSGIADLDRKVIRTPLEPLHTFTDDPLRVLRLVRFASRLQFDIDPDTAKVMAHPHVLEALKVKISRERVGVEFDKMLKGGHPHRALELIDTLGLYHAIFTDPSQKAMAAPDTSRWAVVYDLLDHLLQNQTPGSVGPSLIRTEDARYFAWNLAAMAPWMTTAEPADPKRKANALPTIAVVAREGFKAPNKVSDVIAASYSHRDEIMRLKQAVDEQAPWITERDTLGMAIRKWDVHGGSWRLQVLNAMLIDAMVSLKRWVEHNDDDCTAFLKGWQGFLDHLSELGVSDAPNLKRLLDGRMLASALGVKPGKWTGKALDVCVAWQLRNPDEQDPTGAVEEVRRRRDELEIPAA